MAQEKEWLEARESKRLSIKNMPETNITLIQGDGNATITWQFHAEKTIYNRFRYWMFCKFFPFRIKEWNK